MTETTELIIAELERYKENLRDAPLDDRKAFRRAIVGAQALLGLTQSDLAGEFRASRGSVNRWSQGASAPYAGLRHVIFHRLAERATVRLNQLRKLQAAQAQVIAA